LESLDGKYDMKASLKEVGVLYPAIADAKGRIIDGIHRLAVDPRWPVFKLPDINTDAKYLLARIIANTHRRTVSAQEKTRWLDELAEKTGWNAEKIAKKVGMSTDWVLKYLSDKYKNQTRAEAGRLGGKRSGGGKANLLDSVKQKSSPEPIPPSEPVSTPQPPPSKLGTEPPTHHPPITRDPRKKYIQGLQLWFIPPSNPIMPALYRYCIEKEVHWHVAVLRFLGKGLVEEGYLDEDALSKMFEAEETG